MPLYEYQCVSCNQRTEVIQRHLDPPPASCEKCGGGEMKKLLSAPAIQFKGSGFYKTDYASGSSSSSTSTPAKTDSGSGSASGDAGSNSSESKSSSESKPSESKSSSESKSEPKAASGSKSE